MKTEFSRKEFCTEIVRFRELFGNKNWWEEPLEKREACIKGLTFMYLNVKDTPENEAHCAMIYDATIGEYSQRALWLGKLV